MIATQTPDDPPEDRHVQQIKEKLAVSLKALQRRYVASDAAVTSEDGDANLLCCALEAIFIHGLRSKFRGGGGGGGGAGRKRGERGALPQPFFWNLLKTVTHRDVITELERLTFVGTAVGRCRAWLRLALNHGLLECYLWSLFREEAELRAHYQPGALLLDGEQREVLLSYLQGVASLSFSLSYKSAVLNQWTATPLALAGLCPAPSSPDAAAPLHNGTNSKDLWDTASQSSGSSDATPPPPAMIMVAASSEETPESRAPPLHHSSDVSLDSAHLSSSLSSDSFLQGQERRSPPAQRRTSADLDNGATKRTQRDSQDSMQDDSYVSSSGPDQFSDAALFSGSDGELQAPPAPPPCPAHCGLSDSEPPVAPPSEEEEDEAASSVFPAETEEREEPAQDTPVIKETIDPAPIDPTPVETERPEGRDVASLSGRDPQRSASVSSRKTSESLPTSRSWISEDDFYTAQPEESAISEEAPPPPPPPADIRATQSPPSVVHRRQIGLSNPFRGLLRLGHLERRGAMGLWRDHYCELSPFELRLYGSAEERSCVDNLSLLRCDDARLAVPDGRFDLSFAGKRLYLRAADRGEAEDWVERITEAVVKCRPPQRHDDQWEVLSPENGVEDVSSASSATASPEHGGSGGVEMASPPHMDWTRTTAVEPDAIKEAVLYVSTDAEARSWSPLVFSLSLEALKGFQVTDGRKAARIHHAIADIRDVVPDVSVGGASFFKLLTVRDTLRLRAENPEEARCWRALIRRALDSYLESGDDDTSQDANAAARGVTGAGGGNLQRLVMHRLKENGALLVHLASVAAEKGLDAQGFRCAGCPLQIGPSSGRPKRLCHFSGQYYCQRCHGGDTSIIPARMLHNWDVTPREVSRPALQLLSEVEAEPLLNFDLLNPDLRRHSAAASHTHNLRLKLRLLGDYLLSCRSAAAATLHARMDGRPYLLESSQLYSVKDLRQMAEGQFDVFLLSLLHLASNHVFQCDLCTQRGFICQMCHAHDTIYPFQIDSTSRCKDCKAVFHRACEAAAVGGCPRCERIKKYLERDMQD